MPCRHIFALAAVSAVTISCSPEGSNRMREPAPAVAADEGFTVSESPSPEPRWTVDLGTERSPAARIDDPWYRDGSEPGPPPSVRPSGGNDELMEIVLAPVDYDEPSLPPGEVVVWEAGDTAPPREAPMVDVDETRPAPTDEPAAPMVDIDTLDDTTADEPAAPMVDIDVLDDTTHEPAAPTVEDDAVTEAPADDAPAGAAPEEAIAGLADDGSIVVFAPTVEVMDDGSAAPAQAPAAEPGEDAGFAPPIPYEASEPAPQPAELEEPVVVESGDGAVTLWEDDGEAAAEQTDEPFVDPAFITIIEAPGLEPAAPPVDVDDTVVSEDTAPPTGVEPAPIEPAPAPESPMVDLDDEGDILLPPAGFKEDEPAVLPPADDAEVDPRFITTFEPIEVSDAPPPLDIDESGAVLLPPLEPAPLEPAPLEERPAAAQPPAEQPLTEQARPATPRAAVPAPRLDFTVSIVRGAPQVPAWMLESARGALVAAGCRATTGRGAELVLLGRERRRIMPIEPPAADATPGIITELDFNDVTGRTVPDEGTRPWRARIELVFERWQDDGGPMRRLADVVIHVGTREHGGPAISADDLADLRDVLKRWAEAHAGSTSAS